MIQKRLYKYNFLSIMILIDMILYSYIYVIWKCFVYVSYLLVLKYIYLLFCTSRDL